MRKNYWTLLLPLFLATITLGCNSDDDIIDGKDDGIEKLDPAPLKFLVNANTIEPFQKLRVTLDMDSADILAYDSLKWIANGISTAFFGVVEDDLKNKHFTDYQLGKHRIHVLAYKDGELIDQDSIEYEVKRPAGDFFSVNWSLGLDAKDQRLTFRTGVTPINFLVTGGFGGIEIDLSYFSNSEKSEYALLSYMSWYHTNSDFPKKEESQSEYEKRIQEEINYTRTLFHDMITQFYGNSTCIYSGEDVRESTLWDEYNKRFKNPLGKEIYPSYEEVYPVEIWDTPTASICLFSVYTGWYYVIAEPK